MMIGVSMVAGLLAGVALFLATRKHAVAAAWTALVMGVVGSALFVAILNEWIWPRAGMFHAIAIGLFTGVATALAVGCLVRGERKPVNWAGLAVSAPPVLFLIVFGIAELLGPAH